MTTQFLALAIFLGFLVNIGGSSKLVDFFHEQARRPIVFGVTLGLMFGLFTVLMGVVGPAVTNNPDGSKNAGPIDLWQHFYNAIEVKIFLFDLTAHQLHWLQIGWILDSFAFLIYVPGIAFLWSRGVCRLWPADHWLRFLVLLPFFIAVPDLLENLFIGFPICFSLNVLDNDIGLGLLDITGKITPVKEVFGNIVLAGSILSAIAVNTVPWLRRKRVS